MADLRVVVEVDRDGGVYACRRDNAAESERERVGYTGLDADLVRLFERWLTLRDRQWREDEIRTFGSLLHRCLFPNKIWFWVERALDECREQGRRLRLELAFPADPPWARLAAVPWEFLHRPTTATVEGYFLAGHGDIVLSRRVASQLGQPPLAPVDSLRVLVVVSQPADPRLAEVEYKDVLAEIEQTVAALGYRLDVCLAPTVETLSAAVQDSQTRPHLVHFMGHGEFDPDRGEGRLALVDPAGGSDWVTDRQFADVLTRGSPPPRAVVLHSCEGGRADFAVSFAGVAPQLVRRGVQTVVAMQYPVTNGTATAFSTRLYELLGTGLDLDVAVQQARWALSRLSTPADPRLLGIPVIYLQNHAALVETHSVVAASDSGAGAS